MCVEVKVIFQPCSDDCSSYRLVECMLNADRFMLPEDSIHLNPDIIPCPAYRFGRILSNHPCPNCSTWDSAAPNWPPAALKEPSWLGDSPPDFIWEWWRQQLANYKQGEDFPEMNENSPPEPYALEYFMMTESQIARAELIKFLRGDSELRRMQRSQNTQTIISAISTSPLSDWMSTNENRDPKSAETLTGLSRPALPKSATQAKPRKYENPSYYFVRGWISKEEFLETCDEMTVVKCERHGLAALIKPIWSASTEEPERRRESFGSADTPCPTRWKKISNRESSVPFGCPDTPCPVSFHQPKFRDQFTIPCLKSPMWQTPPNCQPARWAPGSSLGAFSEKYLLPNDVEDEQPPSREGSQGKGFKKDGSGEDGADEERPDEEEPKDEPKRVVSESEQESDEGYSDESWVSEDEAAEPESEDDLF